MFPNSNFGPYTTKFSSFLECSRNSSNRVQGDICLYKPLTTGDEISGLLLTWYNGNWGSICDDVTDCDCTTGGCTSSCNNGHVNVGGGKNLAKVVCRNLGLSGGEEYNSDSASSGYNMIVDGTSNHITGCNGDENHLSECSWLKFGSHNCDHNEAVGVTCKA